MTTLQAVRWLCFSGGAAIAFSSVLGVLMLIPMQPWGARWAKGLSFKQIGAAHLDWIVLGLMQGLAAGLIAACELSPSALAVWAMVAGGWLNPLPYVFRAFGVNAFAFSGGIAQRLTAGLGGFSSALILYAWFVLLAQAWPQVSG